MAVFWTVAPCSVPEGNPRNVGKVVPDYTALCPRTQPASQGLLPNTSGLSFKFSDRFLTNTARSLAQLCATPTSRPRP
jgi:hypothetical protein